MTKEEYLQERNNPEVTNILFFYYRLKGGVIDDKTSFQTHFLASMGNMSLRKPFRQIVEETVLKLNIHFNI